MVFIRILRWFVGFSLDVFLCDSIVLLSLFFMVGALLGRETLKVNDDVLALEPCRLPLDILSESLQTLSLTDAVDTAAVSLCMEMREDICSWALKDNIFGDSTGWCFQEFHSSNEFSVGLMAFTPQDKLPVHDHPGSTGLLVVLDGELSIQNFVIDGVDDDSRVVDVIKSEEIILTSGEYSIFTPDAGNIHMLTSKSDSCRVLDILISPYREDERTWFMPLASATREEDSFRAMRFRKQAISAK